MMTCGLGSIITDSQDPIHAYAIAGIGFFPLLGILGIATLVYKIWRPKNSHHFERRRAIEISEGQIAVKVKDLVDARYSWQLVTHIRVCAGWTFLYQSQAVILAIPDSVIPAEDLLAFQGLIQRKAKALRVLPKNQT